MGLHNGLGNEDPCDVLLATMPWATVSSPSIQLSILKPIANKSGFNCEAFYANLLILPRVGLNVYLKLVDYLPLGDWLFSKQLFGDFSPEAPISDYMEFINNRSAQRVLKESGSLPKKGLLELLFGEDYRTILERIRNVAVPRYIDELTESILRYNAKVVGFTSSFNQNVSSLSLAKAIKSKAPETYIVLGGANCEGIMGPSLLKNFPFVDFAVSGEGEEVFPKLLRALLRDEGRLSGIPGVSFREADIIHNGGNADPIPNLDEYPYLDCSDYFEQLSQLNDTRGGVKPGPIFFECSRGCWWGYHSQCTFCGLNGSNIAFRSRSSGRIGREVLYLSSKHKVTSFQATDNILNPVYFASLLPYFRSLGLGFDFFFEVKATMTKN